MRARTFFFLFGALFVILATARVTRSQTVQGVITGTITDPSGAVVPNVTVTITNEGTSVSQTAITGSDGSYRFSLVPPGIYTITTTKAGFAEVKASGIVVEASQTVPFNVKLELAKTSAVVEVNSQAPLVQTATSDLSTTIDRNTILNAPLVDRDVFSTLPFLAPQVTPGLDLAPTSGGARESGTAYLLNGGDDNDNFSEGAINIHPPLESVQDFSIITNSMSAQYGRGAGAVVSASQKSGTNRFHGSVYEFNRNASLNANDFFYNRQLVQQGPPPNPQLLSKRPKYIRNQFGGEVDGPIIKNKTFFSFAYDRIKLLSGSTSANNFVPTSAAIAFVKANGGTIAQQVLAAAPPVTSDLPCASQPAGTTGGANNVGCLSFFDPQTDTEDSYYGRVDHNFSTSDRLSFNANLFREKFDDKFGGAPLTTKGPIAGDTFNHFHQLTLGETHVFSPRLLNEFSIAHNRHFNVFQEGNGTKDTLPNILIDNQNEGGLGYFIGGDFEGGQVQNFTQDRWGLSDNLTWTSGRHSLKFGFGGQYGILYRNWDLGLPGQYEFGELFAVDPACATQGNVVTAACDGTLQPDGTITNVSDQTRTNFAGDYPYFQETAVNPATGARADAYRHYTYHDYYAFAQDDWKIRPTLTLNLGVRWDRYGAPSEDHNILAQFTSVCANLLDATCIGNMRVGPVKRMWPTQNHDFAPRIGFAWDVFGNGKMAVRGGYGIFYDRIFDNIWSNGAWNPPFYALLDFDASVSDAVFYSNPASIGAAYNPNGPCGPIPYGPNPATGCTGSKRVSVRTMDQSMKDASGQNFYLGVERQLWSNMMFRVNYQGSLGRHLPMLENYNREDGIAANSKLTSIRPNALYTGFNYRSDSVSSNYNALVLEVQKRLSSGLEFQTGYTYSKLLDVNSDLFAGCSTIGGATAPYYYISNNRQHLSYGPAAYDHRHAYKFSLTYSLPFLKSEKGFIGHALGGWSFGSFFQYYFGHPIDVHDGRGIYRFARDVNKNKVLDANGIPINLGGDYNLDSVNNDHPIFVGKSVSSVYSGKSPADGIFIDNNVIGCGAPWVPATVALSGSGSIDACNVHFGVAGASNGGVGNPPPSPGTPNSLFVTPAYPSSGPTFERFGTLGRNVFHGPAFVSMDMSLAKSFPVTETTKLDFRFQAQNLFNHPNFDCVDTNLGSGTFGQAGCLTPFGLGAPKSRVMSLGLRFSF
ncbi:MAG TPA: TonB-dependent receptor [Candidatus Sulfotelmatobacter sp.]|nr:TonB-dependent receptor [Candidatus Sulfotelmatobacter sp.]